MNIYYITVKFLGTPYVAPANDTTTEPTNTTTFVPTGITFNITNVTWKSTSQLSFS